MLNAVGDVLALAALPSSDLHCEAQILPYESGLERAWSGITRCDQWPCVKSLTSSSLEGVLNDPSRVMCNEPRMDPRI